MDRRKACRCNLRLSRKKNYVISVRCSRTRITTGSAAVSRCNSTSVRRKFTVATITLHPFFPLTVGLFIATTAAMALGWPIGTDVNAELHPRLTRRF